MAIQDKNIEKQLRKLGERFQELRKEKGYSNYESFAFEHNLPRAQYGRYEKGQDLRFSSLSKVLKALDITFEEFFKDFGEE